MVWPPAARVGAERAASKAISKPDKAEGISWVRRRCVQTTDGRASLLVARLTGVKKGGGGVIVEEGTATVLLVNGLSPHRG